MESVGGDMIKSNLCTSQNKSILEQAGKGLEAERTRKQVH